MFNSVLVLVLCAIFFVPNHTIYYLLQTAGYLFVAGIARVAYFMALGRPMRSLKKYLSRYGVCSHLGVQIVRPSHWALLLILSVLVSLVRS